MIMKRDVQNASGFRDRAGHLAILATGGWIARWMIVGDDQARRRARQGGLEDLSWMNDRRVERAYGDHYLPDELVAGVET
jgi:hypothetical protein